VAIVVEVIEAEAVEANKVEEIAIEVGANIEVKDAVVELKEEEVTITLVIGYYY
jgi:hypothetical protein